MKATMEQLEHSRVKLTITVEAAEFEAAMQKAYLSTRGRIAVPGFRKGKAPRRIIEQTYGEGVFYEDAFETVYRDTYPKAAEEYALETVEDPQLDVEQIESGSDLIYTAEVTVRPEVTLGQYKGIEVTKPAYPVDDEAINAEIEQARERVATWADVDGAAEMGHNVIIDYAGTVDGVAFQGGTAEMQSLQLGSGRFIPGFEEGVVGMAIDEERDVPVTFPTEYHAEELAGKEAIFHVKLHQVQKKELPALDDELAKDVSEHETLDAYRADIRQRLEQQAEQRADAEYENALIDAIAANATVEIPDVMIEHQIDDSLREMSYRLAMQGMRLEQFLTYTGQTIEALRDQYRPESERRVRAGLALEAIRKAEGIDFDAAADDALLDKELADIAQARSKSVEEVRAGLSDNERQYIVDRIVTQKVIDLVRNQAVALAPEAEAKPAAKPKKSTKKAKQTEVTAEEAVPSKEE